MSNKRLLVVVCIAAATAWSVTLAAAVPALLVRVDGVLLPPGKVLSVVVDSENGRPHSALVTLTAGTPVPQAGRGIDIAAVDGQIVFMGEVLDFTASPGGGRQGVTVRAFDRRHRLARSQRTREFFNQSDAEIARQLVAEADLELRAPISLELSTPHSRVVQHSQTDLEFLQERAARIGYELAVEGTILELRKRREGPTTAVGCAAGAVPMRTFLAWLSSPGVARVGVRGWDPVKKIEIEGAAQQDVIPLSAAGAQGDPPPAVLDLGFVEALQSASAVHAAAAGTLAALTAGDVSAEVEVPGTPSLRAGARVAIQGAGTPFNGDYYVAQTSHRFGRDGRPRGRTLLRLVRADRAVFALPEIGDEVLVAFEHGDLGRPFVIGSLWDSDDAPPDTSPCRGRD